MDLDIVILQVLMFQQNWYCKTTQAGIATEIEIEKHPSLVLVLLFILQNSFKANIGIGVVIAKHTHSGDIDVAIAKQPQLISLLVLVLQKLSPEY